MYFYFVGSEADARATFVDELQLWADSLPSSQRSLVNIETLTYSSYYAMRAVTWSTDRTGEDDFRISNRIISRDWVKNNQAEALEYRVFQK